MIEGLSMLIKGARRRGVVKGIKYNSPVSISHMFLMDDIMILGKAPLGR